MAYPYKHNDGVESTYAYLCSSTYLYYNKKHHFGTAGYYIAGCMHISIIKIDSSQNSICFIPSMNQLQLILYMILLQTALYTNLSVTKSHMKHRRVDVYVNHISRGIIKSQVAGVTFVLLPRAQFRLNVEKSGRSATTPVPARRTFYLMN